MMQCPSCGLAIPSDANYCSGCGAEQTRNSAIPVSKPTLIGYVHSKATPSSHSRRVGWIVGGIVGFSALFGIAASDWGDHAPKPAGDAVAASANASVDDSSVSVPTPASSASPENWSYSSDVDKVRGTTSYFASTTSTNAIHQEAPYDGETTMDMTLRKSAKGTDVILRISSGQMMCPSYEGCSGTVRFDNNQPEHLQFNGPADDSSEVVFVSRTKPFIAKLKHAKKIVIEKTLYQAGAPQFEFTTSNLRWDH